MNITLDSALLGLAARFLDGNKPEDAAIKDVISGLTGVYVKSFTFDDGFRLPEIGNRRRAQAAFRPGWQRLVEVRSRKDHTDVDVYISLDRTR